MYFYLIRLKGSQLNDIFESDEIYKIDDTVVVESTRGKELGTILRLMHPLKPFGKVISLANDYELGLYWENMEEEPKSLETAQRYVDELNLEMKILTVQYNLDRSKVFINYTADKRVDFRELLKILSKEFRARIELKQLGIRDHAKLIGCLGTCGLIACCNYKNKFESITINMAKNQMLLLNNSNLSGVCGGLKCCLSYENEDYIQCRKNFPRIKSRVEYQKKEYFVLDFNCISESVLIANENDRIYVQLKELSV